MPVQDLRVNWGIRAQVTNSPVIPSRPAIIYYHWNGTDGYVTQLPASGQGAQVHFIEIDTTHGNAREQHGMTLIHPGDYILDLNMEVDGDCRLDARNFRIQNTIPFGEWLNPTT